MSSLGYSQFRDLFLESLSVPTSKNFVRRTWEFSFNGSLVYFLFISGIRKFSSRLFCELNPNLPQKCIQLLICLKNKIKDNDFTYLSQNKIKMGHRGSVCKMFLKVSKNELCYHKVAKRRKWRHHDVITVILIRSC